MLPVWLVKKWIAGEKISDGLRRAKEANRKGMGALLDYLGEHYTDKKRVNQTVKEYLWLIDLIRKKKIRGSISLKLTQLGLLIGQEYCLQNLLRILRKAKLLVWIDMESAEYTDKTMDIYLRASREHKNLAVTIQANLKRSTKDLDRIIEAGGIVRLVKGAYRESEQIAYMEHDKITENFERLMGTLFLRGNQFAIATHDKKMIEKAMELEKRYRKRIEFQFLMGIRDKLKSDLVKEGYAVSEYIPFGKNWFPYFLRRLRERKRNILLILRSVFPYH